MLTKYIQAAMNNARYEILPDDGSYYGEIPGFEGIYANRTTLEACQEELQEVLEEWLLLRISQHLPLPQIDGIKLSISEVSTSSCKEELPSCEFPILIRLTLEHRYLLES
jgi:predicted RNase H-like HicB family nuclease